MPNVRTAKPTKTLFLQYRNCNSINYLIHIECQNSKCMEVFTVYCKSYYLLEHIQVK